MGSIISAIGTAVPPQRFAQEDILNFMTHAHRLNTAETARLKKLYEVSGIAYRHSVLNDFGPPFIQEAFFKNGAAPDTLQRGKVYEKNAGKLGKNAAKEVFKIGNIDPLEITHLITVSCTGMYAPGLDIDLVEDLGLSTSVERTCINFMGCYGAFNALKTADYICRAQPDAKVLIVDVELCTLHFQKENTLHNWIANSLFADGAAAVLVEAQNQQKQGFRLRSFYNTLAAGLKNEMSWHIGNTGYEMYLSSRIAKNIKGKIGNVTVELLKKAGMQAEDITRFAVHPGGRRILEVCEESLNMPEESLQHSYAVLHDYGNMSSATILFVLQRLMKIIKPGENLAGFAFGPGLTFESMILEAV